MLLSARSHVCLVNGGNSCSGSEPIIHRAGVTNRVHAGTRAPPKRTTLVAPRPVLKIAELVVSKSKVYSVAALL